MDYTETDLHGYKPLKQIAKTETSEYLISQSQIGEVCFLKLVNRPNNNSIDANFFQSEANALSILDHKSILNYRDFFFNDKYYALISCAKKGEPLSSLLQKKQYLPADEAQYIFFCIVNAVQYCHMRGVAHKNLKSSNIIVNQDRVYITDFGIKQLEEISNSYNTSLPYKPPEFFDKSERLDERPLDIWSLGVLLYEMLSGKLPFVASDHDNLKTIIKKAQFSCPGHVSPQAKDLIQKMLEYSPQHRLSSQQILAHPWLSKMRKANIRLNTGKNIFSRSFNVKATTKTIVRPNRKLLNTTKRFF